MKDYKVISSKTVFDSTKIRVDSRKIELPNGKVVEWNVVVFPGITTGVPIRNGKVLMVKEWRQGPETYLTQFTGARTPHESDEENLLELKREQKEEMGIIGGKYEMIVKVAMGPHITGFKTIYFITDFEVGDTARDEDELQELIELPIKGLYDELVKNHVVIGDTLLIAKILEERYNS